MIIQRTVRALAVAGTSAVVVLAGVPVSAAVAPVRTIAAELDGPMGLDVLHARRALVAESVSGKVTSIDLSTGAKTALISGLARPAGVTSWFGKIFVAQGVPGPGEPAGPKPTFPPASILKADKHGKYVRVHADLMAYELKHNPDGQKQFAPDGKPFDALSNPFSILGTPWGILVADGGANAVLSVDPKSGKIRTFFVPPNPRTPECLAPGAQANPGTVGCDAVPTGVAVFENDVYVSTLGGEKPGAATIYKLDGRTGEVVKSWTGFTSLTGIAVSPQGTVYVSEVLHGAPAGNGPPPPGFPANVGRLTRIAGDTVTHAQVTMPTGVEFHRGRLFATTWSIAAGFKVEHAGRLVEVPDGAFS